MSVIAVSRMEASNIVNRMAGFGGAKEVDTGPRINTLFLLLGLVRDMGAARLDILLLAKCKHACGLDSHQLRQEDAR